MRFIKTFVLLFFLSTYLISGHKSSVLALDPYRPLCVGIQGKFTAENWKGGPIQVGCVGDDGGATNVSSQKCTGQIIKDVRVGETFRLTKCSCWGGSKGCLKVGKELRLNPLNSQNRKTITVVKAIKDMPIFKDNQCRQTDISRTCGANGAHIAGNFKITCSVPPSTVPTNSPVPTRNPSHTPTPTPIPSLTPAPSECPGPEKVTNITINCPNCKTTSSAPIETASCGNSTKPLLSLIGSSTQNVASDVDSTATFSLKATSCDPSTDGENTLNLEVSGNVGIGNPLTMSFNPDTLFKGLKKGESKTIQATVKNNGGADSGTSEALNFTATTRSFGGDEAEGNPVTVTINVD